MKSDVVNTSRKSINDELNGKEYYKGCAYQFIY